jgi:hypothetical protein
MTNDGFGIPEVAAIPVVGETQDERMARLQVLADLQIGKESDAEIVERLVAEARAKRAAEMLPTDTAGFPADYDKIEIHEGQGEHDMTYVPLGIGGFVIKAPRGVDIIVPHAFVTECLDHAIETLVTQNKNGLILRNVKRFPYMFKGKATPEEYKQYQAEQKALAAQQLAAAA